jgi:hypothetical protein
LAERESLGACEIPTQSASSRLSKPESYRAVCSTAG